MAVSLAALSVTVPARADLSEDDVYARLESWRRRHAVRRLRTESEPAQKGDDAVVDAFVSASSGLLPFSAREGLSVELVPFGGWPGLAEAAVGRRRGETQTVELELPPTYPVVAFRGQRVELEVTLRAATELTLPEVETPAFLQACGVADVDALLAAVMTELEDARTDELLVEAQERVLELLLTRAQVSVDRSQVDAVLVRAFETFEQPVLRARKISGPEEERMLAAWLLDPLSRARAARDLAADRVLFELAAAERWEFSQTRADELIAQTGCAPTLPGLREQVWRWMILERVLERTQVTFEEA